MSIRSEIKDLTEKLNEKDYCRYAPEDLASMEERLCKLNHVQSLWDEFGNVPMNPCLETIEEPWHGFPAGTWRENIWHWFEKEFGISVADDLIYTTDD